jgi:hypothetical protein
MTNRIPRNRRKLERDCRRYSALIVPKLFPLVLEPMSIGVEAVSSSDLLSRGDSS